MVLPTDKYLSVKDEAAANAITSEIGDDAVTVSERFYFNPDVLERNQDAIETAIGDATTISDSDKAALLLKEVKYYITKGFIDKMAQYGNDKIETVMDTVQPIIQLKNCGGKMEDGGELPADAEHIADVYADHEMLMAIDEHGSGYYESGGAVKVAKFKGDKKFFFNWFK